MTRLVVALLAGAGVHLVWQQSAERPGGAIPVWVLDPLRRVARLAAERRDAWVGCLAAGTGALAASIAVFGWTLPAIACGVLVGGAPAMSLERRRALRNELAHESWPRLIEEVRVLTGSAGRSVPQALFEAGRRAPEELVGTFRAAQRDYVMTADFARCVARMKTAFEHHSADVTLETLLVAHEVGGGDLDRRLAALSADRTRDVEARRLARSEQAGVRFARRFVLVVPLGMAFVGLSIGNGRASYQSPSGQLAAGASVAMVAACWVWAGRIMRIPPPPRVFGR